MHKSYMKYALSWGKHCFLPIFDNVILTLQYMCILVGSSQFCGWFSFGWKISSENGQKWPFLQK